MKTNTTLLLAGTLALGFTLTAVKATETAASPRAQQMVNERKTVTIPDTSPNLVSNLYLGAAAKWELNRPKVVPSETTTPNLVSGNYIGAAVKNPYSRPASVEIAPLKEKSK